MASIDVETTGPVRLAIIDNQLLLRSPYAARIAGGRG